MKLGLALAAAVALAACQGSDQATPVEQGQRVYVANCIACHHLNPSLDGPMGPPVTGSSRALLEARVLRAEYPPDYEPKRDSSLMLPLPYLESEIDALAAYLNSP